MRGWNRFPEMVNWQSAQTNLESMTLPAEGMARMVLMPKKSRQINIVLNEYIHNDCNLKTKYFLKEIRMFRSSKGQLAPKSSL